MVGNTRSHKLVIFQVFWIQCDDSLFPFEFDKTSKLPTFSRDIEELQIEVGDVCISVGDVNVLGKTSTEALALLLAPGSEGRVLPIRILKSNTKSTQIPK